MTVRIINADVFEGLAQLPDESVHCVVTSPPYWGLRSYLPQEHPDKAREIGSEPTLEEHIEVLVRVFREVRRALRKDGSLWLNYGDACCSAGKRDSYIKPKDLMMMPARLAIALCDDGWWVRSDIIWHKLNPMPESCQDRPTSAYEHVFLLTKSARYFYDTEAVREKGGLVTGPGIAGWAAEGSHTPPAHCQGGRQNSHAAAAKNFRKVDSTNTSHVPGAPPHSRLHRAGTPRSMPTRNMRNIWEIASFPFPESHFATFPPALAERCIRAGTSEHGCCTECGAPWMRETEAIFQPQPDVSLRKGIKGSGSQKPMDGTSGWDGFPHGSTLRKTTGWGPGCECEASTMACAILDPFGGAGTTGMVADRLGRDAILIELEDGYASMAERRIARDRLERGAGTMADVTAAQLPPTPLEALIAESGS